MKVHIDLPWGGVLDIEVQPMDPYKFYNLVWGIVLVVVAPSFFCDLELREEARKKYVEG